MQIDFGAVLRRLAGEPLELEVGLPGSFGFCAGVNYGAGELL